MKPELGIFRCLVFVSASVISFVLASKLRKDPPHTETVCQCAQTQEINFALHEGQTIVAVSDRTHAMCFYIGNEGMEETKYE